MHVHIFRVDESQPPQEVLAECLEHVLQARLEQEWPTESVDLAEEFTNMVLAQVLSIGLQPTRAYQVLIENPGRARALLDHEANPRPPLEVIRVRDLANASLFVHSQEVLAQRGQRSLPAVSPQYYQHLSSFGRHCYAATRANDNILPSIVWQRLSWHFMRYSRLLHEAGVKMGFTAHDVKSIIGDTSGITTDDVLDAYGAFEQQPTEMNWVALQEKIQALRQVNPYFALQLPPKPTA